MLHHLLELRRRVLYIFIWFIILFFIFFFLDNDLFQILMSPLRHTLSIQEDLIATQVTAPVLTPLKLAVDVSILLSAPFALFQFWCFVSPGLYEKEQSIVRVVLISSLMLFFTGVLFCFYLVLPCMFYFFAHTVPKGIRYMPDITYALDFITRILMIFGFCFQVPLACFLLVHLKMVTLQALKKIRPYIIVSAFIIGMFLTPPDVFSQLMLALPLCFLYEIGIILAHYFDKKQP